MRNGVLIDPIADKVRLLSNGAIDGYSHPNEASWEYGPNAGTIIFRSADGTLSTFFDTVRVDKGVMSLEGTFAFDNTITHVLEEVAPGWAFHSSYICWLPIKA